MTSRDDEWLIEEFARLVVEKAAEKSGVGLLEALKKGINDTAAKEIRAIIDQQRIHEEHIKKSKPSGDDDFKKFVRTMPSRDDVVRLTEAIEEINKETSEARKDVRAVKQQQTHQKASLEAIKTDLDAVVGDLRSVVVANHGTSGAFVSTLVLGSTRSYLMSALKSSLPAALISSLLTAILLLSGLSIIQKVRWSFDTPAAVTLAPQNPTATPVLVPVPQSPPAAAPQSPSESRANAEQTAEFKQLLATNVAVGTCSNASNAAATFADCIRLMGLDPETISSTSNLLSSNFAANAQLTERYSTFASVLLQWLATSVAKGSAVKLDGKLGPKTWKVLKSMPCVDATLAREQPAKIAFSEHSKIVSSIVKCTGITK